MWFKNIRLYRFTKPFEVAEDVLEQALSSSAFTPCGSQDLMQYGWVSPAGRGSDSLVHAAMGNWMVCARKEEKVIPASVIKEQLDEKVALISAKEARNVGKKERQTLKEEVILTLLPKALPKTHFTYAFITADKEWLVIDASSAGRAEELLIALREAAGNLSVVPIKSTQIPCAIMTRWVLQEIPVPTGFELGHEAELVDQSDEGGSISCKQQSLTSAEIQGHLTAGMKVQKLGLVWREGLEFVMDDQLSLKRLKFLDGIVEKAEESGSESQLEQFDAAFSVMAFELSQLIQDVCAAFGGLDENTPTADEILAGVVETDTVNKEELAEVV